MSDSAVASHATLVNSKLVVPSSKSQYVAVDRHFFRLCLRSVTTRITFDEQWYLKKYPDVADAIRSKVVDSAHEHYLMHGYFENRLPTSIKVDDPWYLDQYPDIREAVKRKQYTSAQEHFDEVGFGEGRLPYANFSLAP